ncbi:hypothetical protein [Nocardioides daphniae]|uniref:Uncharacterized protein n=1 Tax=Nocardioides daphniae TaxID=402297 RepID=A0A4P7UBJ0_9ACTN|nr:hypothetical protein [Nocardioides daphniae]QCC76675.1 hypothetical protein E2C04_04605 [Nocardioides daphniae]
MAMWAGAVGEPGHYVAIFDDGTDEVYSIGHEDPFLADVDTKGQPGPALVRLAEAATAWEAEPRTITPVAEQDDWGGVGGGIGFAFLVGCFVVLPLFWVLRIVVGVRKERKGL